MKLAAALFCLVMCLAMFGVVTQLYRGFDNPRRFRSRLAGFVLTLGLWELSIGAVLLTVNSDSTAWTGTIPVGLVVTAAGSVWTARRYRYRGGHR